jgi:hypothetical protein
MSFQALWMEVQPQRLLQHDPEEPEALQLSRTLQRADVDGPQAPVARELRHRLLCLLVVAGYEHVERLTRHLALD